ncbi:MAG: hypothetical protein IJT50_14630 [Lentisphaeria bacterium]|nr:hypothetical protein [Lentisphaeria bacterium]
MAADTLKITVVCPTCDNNMELPGEKKNMRIECSKCGNAFMAYEAVPCESCGKLRHPRHQCRACVPDNDMARKYRENVAREALNRLPEDVRTVLKFESGKNARLFEEMAQRIRELENQMSELEDEMEELKGKEDE